VESIAKVVLLIGLIGVTGGGGSTQPKSASLQAQPLFRYVLVGCGSSLPEARTPMQLEADLRLLASDPGMSCARPKP